MDSEEGGEDGLQDEVWDYGELTRDVKEQHVGLRVLSSRQLDCATLTRPERVVHFVAEGRKLTQTNYLFVRRHRKFERIAVITRLMNSVLYYTLSSLLGWVHFVFTNYRDIRSTNTINAFNGDFNY